MLNLFFLLLFTVLLVEIHWPVQLPLPHLKWSKKRDLLRGIKCITKSYNVNNILLNKFISLGTSACEIKALLLCSTKLVLYIDLVHLFSLLCTTLFEISMRKVCNWFLSIGQIYPNGRWASRSAAEDSETIPGPCEGGAGKRTVHWSRA